ncbi:hypothetical protein L9W80_08415 [Vibrio aestuarianus]|uniref:hypothetical protein n=1 Tax=Vibrio aestuarianus TaxID=28171 RepID=UPI00237CC664|nr:hypothetical protein [Vibrio aestuarianus]MDE1350180.1 hypothetical protein [Vibrio aestuarianus]
MENEESSSALKGGALQVLILSSIAYLVAYTYEVSFLKYFGASADFVTIDVKAIIGGGIVVFVMFSIVFQLLNIIDIIIKYIVPAGNLEKLFNQFGILFIPVVVLVLISDATFLNKLYIIFLPFPLFWLQVIYPIFVRKNYGSYKEAQTAIIEISNKTSSESVLKNSSESTQKYLLIIAMAIYSVMASSIVGAMSASQQREFFSVQGQQQVLIRTYGDKAILGEVKSEVLSGTFIIRKLEGLTLTKQTYNTLIPESDENSGFLKKIKSFYASLIKIKGD